MNISPVDNRYYNVCNDLRHITSDYGINKIRLEVELAYFKLLMTVLFDTTIDISHMINEFSLTDLDTIRNYEIKTNHDIKALEYFIKKKINIISPDVSKYTEFIHFALTSQDINSVTNTLCLKRSIEFTILPLLEKITYELEAKSKLWKSVPMMSNTHGQPAVTTTMGKEFRVFHSRLMNQIEHLKNVKYTSKFGGAVGNMNAHYFCYEEIDWDTILTGFLRDEFDLERNRFTTQIDHYDNLSEIFDILKRINTIIIDLTQDTWLYIHNNYFKLKINEGDTGSSAMPHKVNPINFENSEGNIYVANSLFSMFSSKLPISRLQRDLTDSTISRNFGVALSHCIISYNSLLKGLGKLEINREKIDSDLDRNWSILMEAVQCVMKTELIDDSYEIIKQISRGTQIDQNAYLEIVDLLELSEKNKNKLLNLTPRTYLGNCKT